MRSILKRSIAFAVYSLCLFSASASADVAPPDICQGEGTVCDNAGPSGTLPGICKASTCPYAEPKPHGGIIYRDCLRCMPASGGAGGSGGAGVAGEANGGEPNAGAPSAGQPGAGGAESDDDGGCSCRLSSGGTERALAASMLLAGFAALRVWRRRR